MRMSKYPEEQNVLNDPKWEVAEAARRIQQALNRMGLCYETKDGHLVEVSYSRVGVVGREYGLLEVDLQRLPRKVTVNKLAHRDTLHHLTAVVGKPVKKLNTTGLTYCVVLSPEPKGRLPKRVSLDMSKRPPGEYVIPVGQGRKGAVWRSLLDTSHILVGGESRSGKSTWLNSMLAAILNVYGADEVNLAIVDPKGVEFTAYANIPHLAVPIAEDPKQAGEVTDWLMGEMSRRRRLFAGYFAKNLVSYNSRVRERLPLIVAVIDEVTDIALQCGLRSRFYTNLIRLASKSGSFGIVLILATQNPKAEVLNTLIRGNLSTRIAFRVATHEHSRTILGTKGAERLSREVRGRMLARLDVGLIELQGFLVTDAEILALAQRLGGGSVGPRLEPIEYDLVSYAVAHLNGGFKIGELARVFADDDRTSAWRIRKLAESWEQEGLLSKPAHAAAPRQVTPQLLAILEAQGSERPDDPSVA
ncbi:MAG: FtsK/SpoIIIE domain-containing protein [Chloroflexota bacterium]|nr:FtsK/SpoIIIE domain-containing protein [Chloroflexota bacterium]